MKNKKKLSGAYRRLRGRVILRLPVKNHLFKSLYFLKELRYIHKTRITSDHKYKSIVVI